MFRLATGADIGGPAKGMWVAERTDPYDRIAGAPYSANGYHGHANRAGWANLFGGQERDWQDYEHVRHHQAGKDFEVGVDNVILAGKDGQPAEGRSIIISGKKWTSGPGGKLRMIDMEYFSKAAQAEEERRTYTLQLTKLALGSSLIANQMFGLVSGRKFTDWLVAGKRDGADEPQKTWKAMGVPIDLYEIPADIDMVNSLSPYSQLYQQAVCKIQCVIRALSVVPVGGELPSLSGPVGTEDQKRLATQAGKTVDVS